MPKQQDSREVRISVMDKGYGVQLLINDVMTWEVTRVSRLEAVTEAFAMLESVRAPEPA